MKRSEKPDLKIEISRRDTLTKEFIDCENIETTTKNMLNDIQNNLLQKSLKFRKENTSGDDVPEYKPKKLPILSEVAKAWNIKIQFEKSDHGEYGFYSSSKNLISLASEDPSVFFHELAHVADSRVQNGLKGGQDPIQEAVAELVAGVLCKMYGVDRTKVVHDYIEHYCTEKGKNKVETISGREHLSVLYQTVKSARKSVCILSGWLNESVVNRELLKLLRSKLAGVSGLFYFFSVFFLADKMCIVWNLYYFKLW